MLKKTENKEIPFCWEVMQCPDKIKDKCETFIMNMGRECWFIRDIAQGGPFSKKQGGCLECEFFKKYGKDSFDR